MTLLMVVMTMIAYTVKMEKIISMVVVEMIMLLVGLRKSKLTGLHG